MIHVCFGLYDKDGRYSKFTGTAILSMFENHSQPPPSVTVHLLHDNTLTPDNRDKFSYIAGRYGQIIKFYNVEEICKNEIARLNELFKNYAHVKIVTMASMYRLLAPQIFSDIEKIIYLDSDIIVNLDISELWQIFLNDKTLAAAPEILIDDVSNKDWWISRHYLTAHNITKFEDYFNAGVLIINVNQLRKDFSILNNAISFVANNPECHLFDQDMLNYAFATNYVKLPEYFDVFVSVERKRNKNLNVRKAIYHYIGDSLKTHLNDPLNRLWFNYFEKTPFFNKEIIGRLDEGYRQIINQQNVGMKNFAVQLTALMAGKERAFFTTVQNINALKRFFFIREGEEIIPLENQESFNVLANSMKNSLGKKIFFIFFEGYPHLRVALINAGFVEERDFINATMFLSDAKGVPLNTYELVKAM